MYNHVKIKNRKNVLNLKIKNNKLSYFATIRISNNILSELIIFYPPKIIRKPPVSS